MYDNCSFSFLEKLNSFITDKVNISSATIKFHAINKHQRKRGDYFNGTFFLWHFRRCQYNRNACMIITALSY